MAKPVPNMSWKPCEDISCVHAFLSLEEIRNRRALVREGDYVEYDYIGREVKGIEPSSTSLRSKKFNVNFSAGKHIEALKSQFGKLFQPVLKRGDISLWNRRNVTSCFKPSAVKNLKPSERFEAKFSGLSSLLPQAKSSQGDKRTPAASKLVRSEVDGASTLSASADLSKDSSRTMSICGDESDLSARASQGKDRVKSKLPSEEAVPHVEEGFVKRAIRSYTLNVVNARGDRDSLDDEIDSVASRDNSASPPNRHRQLSLSVVHSVISSRSESPISATGVKLGNLDPKGDYQAKVKRSDSFKSSYVARIAESLDYFIGHEQSETLPGLRPISPISR